MCDPFIYGLVSQRVQSGQAEF